MTSDGSTAVGGGCIGTQVDVGRLRASCFGVRFFSGLMLTISKVPAVSKTLYIDKRFVWRNLLSRNLTFRFVRPFTWILFLRRTYCPTDLAFMNSAREET